MKSQRIEENFDFSSSICGHFQSDLSRHHPKNLVLGSSLQVTDFSVVLHGLAWFWILLESRGWGLQKAPHYPLQSISGTFRPHRMEMPLILHVPPPDLLLLLQISRTEKVLPEHILFMHVQGTSSDVCKNISEHFQSGFWPNCSTENLLLKVLTWMQAKYGGVGDTWDWLDNNNNSLKL